MTTEQTQTFVTQRGDRLIDLCKRVYGIRDPDRALVVATAVSTATPKNRSAVANKFGVPLPAGVELDFPPWTTVQGLMKALETRKVAVQVATTTPRQNQNPIAPMRQVAIGKQGSAPLGERSLPKEMAKALGLGAQSAVEEVRLLGSDDADPSRTQSAAATKTAALGRKLAKEANRATLAELMQQSEKSFLQSFEMMLQKLNPRSFIPTADLQPTIAVILGGFFFGLADRLNDEAKLELDRRKKLLERAMSRVKLQELGLTPGAAASKVFGADPAKAYAAIEQALPTPVDGKGPRVVAQVRQQYGITGSAHESKIFMAPPKATLSPLVSFLDSFAPAGEDGPLAARLFELVTRVSDTHRVAVQQALVLTEKLEIDEKENPNAALAKHLGALLTTLRNTRTGKPAEEQTRLLADERHLLSGRNFVSFRKDIALALDKRLTMAAHLSAHQRMTILLALLMQDGHRLPTMRIEEMDAACERLMQALP